MILRTIEQLDDARFDEHGLLPVVAQHALTGSVLMLAYANREALQRTLETKRLHFYSRSRQQLWQKGETSGHTMQVVGLHLDCDRDAIVAQVIPAGPACHTGASTCFGVEPVLSALAALVEQRARDLPDGSYTTKLLRDQNLRLKKIGEEATEFVLACQSGEKVASEAADLIYHIMVAMQGAGVSVNHVLEELEARR